MGYFSNLAVEVCPADRPDDSYPSAERQLLQHDRSIAGEEMNGYEQITWISLLFPAGVLQSA